MKKFNEDFADRALGWSLNSFCDDGSRLGIGVAMDVILADAKLMYDFMTGDSPLFPDSEYDKTPTPKLKEDDKQSLTKQSLAALSSA